MPRRGLALVVGATLLFGGSTFSSLVAGDVLSLDKDGSVKRFNGVTGDHIGGLPVFNIASFANGIAVDADNKVYVVSLIPGTPGVPGSYDRGAVFKFDLNGDNFQELVHRNVVPGVRQPQDVVLGPDGKLYVSDAHDHSIKRFDRITSDPDPAGTAVFASGNGLSTPGHMVFRPNGGNLFVASRGTGEVFEFDRVSGNFVKKFVTAGSGLLDFPWGITFGPADGHLYVSSQDPILGTYSIMRFDGTTGQPFGRTGSTTDARFIAQSDMPMDISLDRPEDLTFGADGRLYVQNRDHEVLSFKPDGTLVRPFIKASVESDFVFLNGQASPHKITVWLLEAGKFGRLARVEMENAEKFFPGETVNDTLNGLAHIATAISHIGRAKTSLQEALTHPEPARDVQASAAIEARLQAASYRLDQVVSDLVALTIDLICGGSLNLQMAQQCTAPNLDPSFSKLDLGLEHIQGAIALAGVSIPTVTQWGLFGLVLLLLSVAIFRVRRERIV